MTLAVGLTDERPVHEFRSLGPAASLFHSLSDPGRLVLLQHLALGEHRVADLEEHLGLAQSTVSAHVACLRDCGLVTSRPHGRASMFSLAAGRELMAVLAAAERLLDVTGDVVELCPRHGRRDGRRPRQVTATESTLSGEVERLTRRGLRLARFTVVCNLAEGAVAIAGIAAGLVSLVGLGLDSGIESIAAVLVGLRLDARLRDGEADERRERQTLRLVAVTFFLRAGYVSVEGIRDLVAGEAPDSSPVCMVLVALSMVVMPQLARAKRNVAIWLGGDPLILADAAETRICILLSIATLAGFALFALMGATGLDPVAGSVIAIFAIHEGRDAWEGELVEDHDDDHLTAGEQES